MRWIVLVLVASYWPLQAPLWGADQVQSYFVPLGVILLASLVFLANRKIRSLFWMNLKRSPHIVLYCLAMIGSQLFVIVLYPEKPGIVVTAVGYVFVTLAGYLLFPVVIGSLNIERWWSAVSVIGLVSASLTLLSAFSGVEDLGIVHLATPQEFFIPGTYTTSGPVFEPNILGFILVFGTIAGLYLFSRPRKRRQGLITVVVCSFALLFTWSRGMYLAWIFLIGLWFFWSVRRSTAAFFFGPLFVLLAIIALASFHPGGFLDDLFTFSQGATGRNVLWAAAWRAIKERPLSGYGFGNLTEVVFTHGGDQWFYRPLGSHNGFLDLGVQAGLVPVVLFIVTIIVSLIRLVGSELEKTEKHALLVSVSSVIMAVVALSYLLGGANLSSLFITVILGICNYAPRAAAVRVDLSTGFVQHSQVSASS